MVANAAFVFIKPHANTEAVKGLVKDKFEKAGIKIVSETALTCEVIDQNKHIDNHYWAIASKATILEPKELNVPADKFKAQFGLEWQEALDSGKVYNAMGGCAELGIDAQQMDSAWATCKKAKKLVKFGGGFYCGLIDSVEGKEPIYVFNGFFMSMRSKFTAPGESIYMFTVEFDALKWADFRGKVLGPTDPAEAPEDSLRGMIAAQWQGLGLQAECNVGDNAVHASASPFEGLAERLNWCSAVLEEDSFGAAMLEAGVTKEMIMDWSKDPQVVLEDGSKGSIFDAVEDLDADECLAKLVKLAGAQ